MTPIEEGRGKAIIFALGGVNCAIELSGENSARLRTALEEVIEMGRRVDRATTGRPFCVDLSTRSQRKT